MHTRDRSFSLGDLRLRYRDEGEGPAVVFVHGWTMDLDVWDPQCADLGRSMRVLRLDRRGFGLSEGNPDLAADPGDLRALLDHLQVAGATVVGMSQGARSALAFALGFPERTSGLVLDGPPSHVTGIEGEEGFSLDGFRSLARRSGLAAFREQWRAHPLMHLHTEDATAHELVARMLARYPGRDLLEPDVKPVPLPDAKSFARLLQPVLVLNGEFDTRARRQAGEELCRSLPRAEHTLVPDAGHLANLDNPRAYNEILRAFLRRQSRAAA